MLGKMNVAEDQSESPVDATNKGPRNCNAGQVWSAAFSGDAQARIHS